MKENPLVEGNSFSEFSKKMRHEPSFEEVIEKLERRTRQ